MFIIQPHSTRGGISHFVHSSAVRRDPGFLTSPSHFFFLCQTVIIKEQMLSFRKASVICVCVCRCVSVCPFWGILCIQYAYGYLYVNVCMCECVCVCVFSHANLYVFCVPSMLLVPVFIGSSVPDSSICLISLLWVT